MTHEDAYRVLARIGFTRVCDLDLLLFFARHPRVLIASESLAAFLGCDLKNIADSLDILMAAGLLSRAQTTAHAARLYVFCPDETSHEWLPSVLALASTRDGRLALRKVLRARRDEVGERSQRGKPESLMKPGPRHIVESPRRHTGTTRRGRT